MFNKNNKGGMSIEAIVVIAIILTLGIIAFIYFGNKLNEQKGKIEDNMTENYKDRELVVNINQKDDEVTDEPDKLFDGIESDGELVNLTFYLPLGELQDRTKIITLDGLKEIESLKASNGGQVEVVKIDGDDVTIKVTGGDIAERVVISGQYITEHTKFIEKQPTANYSDSDGYKGTLTRYLAYHEPAYNKPVSSSRTSLINIFPASIDYTEDGLKTTLYKSGSPERKVIMGSDTKTKTVTAQTNKDYFESIIDNGVLTFYRGTLTQYVYSGEASKSKISTTTRSNTMNIFPERINFEDGDYSGVLWKSGPSTSVVTKGSAGDSKKVTAQPRAIYSEKINDNGVMTSYTGTLTPYVSKGSNRQTKTVTEVVKSDVNKFNNQIPYSEEIDDNGVKTKFTGTLSKSGNPSVFVAKGSDKKTKKVTGQESPDYNEEIEDNGVTTAYTGTLTAYVNKGSASRTKSVTDYVFNEVNSFEDTIKYSETFEDNGIETSYEGTLTKSDEALKIVGKGSDKATKKVTGQESPDYNEEIEDNGVTTAYTGTLNAYVSKGSPEETKSVTSSITYTTTNVPLFPTTMSYIEYVDDNNSLTAYIGTLTKDDKPIEKRVHAGSDKATKEVTGQDSPIYTETIDDNGVKTSYTGNLTKYVANGSDSASKTASKNVTSTTNSFAETIPYSEDITDNGVYTAYTGTLSKSGNVTSTVTKGSNLHTKYVTNQMSPSYSEYVNDNGIGTNYTGYLSQYVVNGSANNSKYVTGQYSSYYSEYVNDNGVGTYYSGNLSPYVTGGSASDSKYVTGQYSSYYNDGTYSGSLSAYVYSGSAGDSKYVTGQYSSYYNDGTYSGSLSSYVYSGSPGYNVGISASTCYNNVIVTYRNYVAVSRTPINECPVTKTAYYDGQQYTLYKYAYATKNCGERSTWSSGTCTEPWTSTYSGTAYKPDTRVYRYQGTVYKPDTRVYRYQGTVYKPDTRTYAYAGTVNKPDTRVYRYQGNVTKPDTREYLYSQTYSGTVNKPDTRIYKYKGTVSKPDTRIYNYSQSYSGFATKPDTREYLYEGTVTKPDTRIYNYKQKYEGTVRKPDTREYLYEGTVTKPDTRVYGYAQTYTGTVTKPDTREYLYEGIVTKPDTREYLYTQAYSGTTTTPDTRVYRYQGEVTKPDTRIYEYKQNYIGTLYIPEKAVYLYRGDVTRPASDTRVFANYYEYEVKVGYYKKK